MLKVNEIFYSIQGESTHAGRPCVFVRLTGCNLRCNYCDTTYAYNEGVGKSVDAIIAKIKNYNCNFVEITGGEPLLQTETTSLIDKLCSANYEVLIETGGSISVENINKTAILILDIKCPDSGMQHKNLFENLSFLKETDEIKFVVSSAKDFNWACEITKKYALDKKHKVIFSPVFDRLNYQELAKLVLSSKLNIRMQIQLHKIIWHPEERGV